MRRKIRLKPVELTVDDNGNVPLAPVVATSVYRDSEDRSVLRKLPYLGVHADELVDAGLAEYVQPTPYEVRDMLSEANNNWGLGDLIEAIVNAGALNQVIDALKVQND